MMSNNALQLSVQYIQQGNLDRAEETLRGLLREDGNNVQGWCLLGRIRQVRGRPDEALSLYQQAARLAPQSAEIYSLTGAALLQLGQVKQAQACLEEALRLDPYHSEAYGNLGKIHMLNQAADQALACFREAVRLQPGNIEALNNLALLLIMKRQFEEARPLLEQLVRAMPNLAAGHLSLSVLHFEQGELEPALTAAQRAVQLDANLAAAHAQLGAVLLKMGRLHEAIASLQAALRLAPQLVQALEHLGLALKGLGRLDEAEHHLRTAVQLDPTNARILGHLAGVLCDRQQWHEAIALGSSATQRNLLSRALLHNLGMAYHQLNQPQLAIAALEQAIAVLEQDIHVRPTPETFALLGWAYLAAGRPDQGHLTFQKALELAPDSAVTLAGLAGACKDMGLPDEAIAWYRKSLAVKPDQPDTHSILVFTLHASPNVTPEEIFHEHCDWARRFAPTPASGPLPHANDRDPERRLRIGYVSGDFCTHVVANYLQLLLAAHDRQRFEIFCYANVSRPDALTQSFQKLADQWRDIYCVSDEQVEQRIRQDQIDILVDLAGHTAGGRLTLFARKPAPVQVTHFGYMNTTGLTAMDYRITDASCDPPGTTERYHTEQLVRLPQTFWCYRPDIEVEVNPLPAASADHVTFGMFNNFPKVTPQAIAVWAQILQRLPGSRLLMVASGEEKAQQRLRNAFAEHGVQPERLTLVGRQGGADYFRLYNRIDVALDTFPYTGLYTTADSLWMGVPVITLQGATYVTRQAASLLAQVGLSEAITRTVEEYGETAVRLASNRARLAEIRAGLRDRMKDSPLMNPQFFTRQLEEAYRGMWRQWCLRDTQASSH